MKVLTQARTSRYKYSPLNTDELYEDPTYYGDVDLFGIFPILMSASIMIPPLLNWCSHVLGHTCSFY